MITSFSDCGFPVNSLLRRFSKTQSAPCVLSRSGGVGTEEEVAEGAA